jgi:outer membrane protein TolC
MLANGEQTAKDNFDSASSRDWAALRTAIAQLEQTLPLLKKQRSVQHDLLTALTAQYPPAVQGAFTSLAALQLPRDLPVMLPSELVAQRPDVRAAEANLHAATAQVGVAIANRIPLFNISGNIGRTSSQFGNLANPAPPFLFWTLAGSVTQTIFDGFTLEQRQRAAEAGWDHAAEQYQSTVVNAFQNVSDALQAIELDSQSVSKAQDATKAALENLCLTAAGFAGYSGAADAGSVSDLDQINDRKGQKEALARDFGTWWKTVCGRDAKFEARLRKLLQDDEPTPQDTAPQPGPPSGIDVVSSEQLYLSTRLSLVTARAARLSDAVALFQALGGGWWNRGASEEPGGGLLTSSIPRDSVASKTADGDRYR